MHEINNANIDNFNNNIASIFSSAAVVEQGLSLAVYLGSKKIYIMGVELNGIVYLMNDKESHFKLGPEVIN